MNDISERRRVKLTALEEIRQQIKDLEVIVICAYADGKIEPLEAVDISLDYTGSDELYTKLIDREDFQDLRVRDIRTIARVVSIVHNSPVRLQPFFESDELERLFRTVVSA